MTANLKTSTFFSLFVIPVITTLSMAHATYAQNSCSQVFSVILNSRQTALLEKTMTAFANFETTQKLALLAEVKSFLSRDQEGLFTKKLNSLIEQAQSKGQNLIDVLRENLQTAVEANQIEQRLADFKDLKPGSLERVLGAKTREESLKYFAGENPLQPSTESHLGRFISKTGARTTITTFAQQPPATGITTQGQPKLVVEVKPKDFKDFAALLADPHLFAHYHTPQQGTLHVIHEGKLGNYAMLNSDTSDYFFSNRTIIPTLILGSREANRLHHYFELGRMIVNQRDAGSAYARYPWKINNKENEQYCARGGYSSCTFWVGDIPMGPERTFNYEFPGKVDGHADGDMQPGTQSQELKPYAKADIVRIASSFLGLSSNSITPEIQAQLDAVAEQTLKVWTYPGHQKLSEYLGLKQENLYGEFANPGYVAHRLTASTRLEDVPVVFRITGEQENVDLQTFDPMISAY